MSGFFSPNLQILSTWKSSLQIAFQKLARIKFATNNTFEWQDFDPQINWNGITASNVAILYSQYLLINKILFISVSVTSTIAAGTATTITITIPGTTPLISAVAAEQGGALPMDVGGTNVTGRWYLLEGANRLGIQTNTGGVMGGPGVLNFYLNTFLQVI